MQMIADLHLHSKYSRAVSKNMVVAEMSRQAGRKGIGLLGTGDWFHSIWMKQLESDLDEWGEGIYQSRENPQGAKFILSAEISNIFKQGGKSRRVHTLIFSPDFSVCRKINGKLIKRGCNLSSDGRPIIGLTVKELAELVFSVSERCLIIPAHVWTPWYSTYGSKSGFDSIEEAYGEFADRIFAVETGLSSDPAMNWRIKELESRTIVSFSDAHSPAKLGREATVFRTKNGMTNDKLQMTKYSYGDIYEAIGERFLGSNEGKLEVAYTIEFYPEEGKYHYSGHRKCGVVQSPSETKERGTTCHVCGRPLTVGVMHRVEELAEKEFPSRPAYNSRRAGSFGKTQDKRDDSAGLGSLPAESNNMTKPVKKISKTGVVGYYHPTDKTRPPYIMMVTLLEILSEVYGVGAGSKRVGQEYDRLVSEIDGEFEILLKTDAGDLEKVGGERLAEAIKKVREGDIAVNPGYDGVFGVVKIWPSSAKASEEQGEQMGLF